MIDPMDPSFWKIQWDALSSNPGPTAIFAVLVAIGTWWFRKHIDKGQIEGLKSQNDALKEKHAVLEARLASEKVQPEAQKILETDQKGNVKPPEPPSLSESHAMETGSAEPGPLHWLMLMELAYQEDTDCLSKVEEYYNKCKSTLEDFPSTFIEAQYLLSRFKCGDFSALSKLQSQGGPRPDAYHANIFLAEYYKSIGRNDEALTYLEYRFEHAPNIDSKLYSALSLAQFMADTSRFCEAISFLKTQTVYFPATQHQADIWEGLGKIYGTRPQYTWRQLMCFEQSLKLNPNNTKLRFTRSYSYGSTTYGKAMAAHHYQILKEQTPRDTTVANNLSVIYDAFGAVTTKISLLRSARHRGKDVYVAANLATAYARAGFTADASECLTDVSVRDQQKGIVRAAYDTIAAQTESDKKIDEKLLRLWTIQKALIHSKALNQLDKTDEELLTKFFGSWLLEYPDATEKTTLIEISMKAGNLAGTITTENASYEYAAYKVTLRHEPGLLELNAQLDESTLKERTAVKEGVAYTSTSNALLSLLSTGWSRPDAQLKLILVPGGADSLEGIMATNTIASEDSRDKLMLDAREVHLTRKLPAHSN